MELGLSGRVALVTGGSKGIGLATARALAAEGARVFLVARRQGTLDEAVAGIPGAAGFTADLTDSEAARAALDACEAEFGPLDILVNSAGAARRTPPDELDPAAYRAAMDAKYFTYINMIDPAVKRMAARGTGVIVNVIGNGGKAPSPIHVPGGAANAALMLATAGLALAYARQGVRIVALNPGLTNTGRVAEGLESDARFAGISIEEARQKAVRRIPMGRMAEPEEIADAAVFLASDKAAYISGVSISMDGLQTPFVV